MAASTGSSRLPSERTVSRREAQPDLQADQRERGLLEQVRHVEVAVRDQQRDHAPAATIGTEQHARRQPHAARHRRAPGGTPSVSSQPLPSPSTVTPRRAGPGVAREQDREQQRREQHDDSTRRYCMNATSRPSAPSSSDIATIPDAPPAIIPSAAVGGSTNVKRASTRAGGQADRERAAR